MLIFINHTESDLADVPNAHVITINSIRNLMKCNL